jgi:maleate isomerase
MKGSKTALLVVPASNTTVEPEMAALLPGYPRRLVARLPRTGAAPDPDDIAPYAESTLAATEPFIKDSPDIVIHGCTSAGFLAGHAGNKAIVDSLAERFACPVVSTADAMIEALDHTDAKHVAVVTPYTRAVNDGLRAYLAQAGIEVDVLSTFDCTTIEDLCAITEKQVLERALETAGTMHDALFIACTQLPTMNVLGPLRARLGIPVWSSISATAWVAAHQARPAAHAA